MHRHTRILSAIAVAAACLFIGCGAKQFHYAVTANTSIAQAIFTLQDEEIAAHTANLIDDAHHAQYKAVIVKLLQAGDDLTVALREWDQSQPAPANIGLAVTQVSNLLNDLNLMTPTANKVIAAAQAVLSVLRGTGVLPSDGSYSADDSLAVAVISRLNPNVAGREQRGHHSVAFDAFDRRPHDVRANLQPVAQARLHASILLQAVARG